MVIVIMGVSGSGKSTVGRLLAEACGSAFLEGDNFHPPANVEAMRAGMALTDALRWPWLDAIADAAASKKRVVIACSALKRRYRDLLRNRLGTVALVHLHGNQAEIAERLARRSGHFMAPGLLPSQFATLERPDVDEDALILSVDASPQDLVAAILQWLAARPDGQSFLSGI